MKPGSLARAGAVAAILAALAACGEPPIEDIAFEDTRTAAREGNDAFAEYKGKRVRWTGQTVTVERRFGDDYAEEAWLLLDMDGVAGHDVEVPVKLSQRDAFAVGQPVTFVATITGATSGGGVITMGSVTLE